MNEQISTTLYESPSLNELYAALSKAQGDMEAAKMDKKNPFFKSKYADLASVINSSRPHLSSNGLSVIQRIMTNDRGMHLFTRLCHASGQWIESVMPLNPSKNTIQELGSYITYSKRYSYASMIGVVAEDEDDDGETAMASNEKKPDHGKITPRQLQILKKHMDVLSISDVEGFLNHYKINKTEELPFEDFEKANKQLSIKVANQMKSRNKNENN